MLWTTGSIMLAVKNPLSRDFENHRPASEGAWLVSIGLFGSCHKATQRSPASKGAMCGRQTALVFAHACGSLWGPLGPKVSYGHTLSFAPVHGWGNEQGTLAAQGFHAHAAELGFSPEDCDPSNLLEVFYQSKARRSQALLRILKRHLRQVKDGAFCYRCKGDFPAFR